MAEVVERKERVVVKLTNAELNTLLIAPAKTRGFIDFDPTRVAVDQKDTGFEITFERIGT